MCRLQGVTTEFIEERLEELLRSQPAAEAGGGGGFGIESCTQRGGDLVYIPGQWHHATVNLAESVSVSWREQLMDSGQVGRAAGPGLEEVARRWAAAGQGDQGAGSVVPLTGEDGAPRPAAEGCLYSRTRHKVNRGAVGGGTAVDFRA